MLFPSLDSYQRIGVVGLGKNVGKTTALCHLIQQAIGEGRTVGLLSCGVDGEARDAWSGIEKPAIEASPGMYVITGEWSLAEATARYEIIEACQWNGIWGALFLVKIISYGRIKLSGTPKASDLKEAIVRLKQVGCDLCLIDGAYDRLVASDPDLVDGVVVVGGAAAAATIDELTRDLRKIIDIRELPLSPLAECFEDLPRNGAIRMFREKKGTDGWQDWDKSEIMGSLLLERERIKAYSEQGFHHLLIGGSFNERDGELLLTLPFAITVHLLSATHSFISLVLLKKLTRKGHHMYLGKKNKTIAIVVNPHHPSAVGFSPQRVLYEMSHNFPRHFVVDIKRARRMIPS